MKHSPRAAMYKHLKVPDLPVVVGALGNGGPDARGKKVAFIKTAHFARDKDQSPNTGHGHHWFGNAESYFLIGKALGEGMKKLLNPS